MSPNQIIGGKLDGLKTAKTKFQHAGKERKESACQE